MEGIQSGVALSPEEIQELKQRLEQLRRARTELELAEISKKLSIAVRQDEVRKLKEQLVAVTVPAAADTGFHADVLREVEIEAGGVTLVGTLHVDMPENHQRVLDYLNLAPAFVPLYAGSRLHLVHKRHVARLTEGRS